jgi:hypothetical protein
MPEVYTTAGANHRRQAVATLMAWAPRRRGRSRAARRLGLAERSTSSAEPAASAPAGRAGDRARAAACPRGFPLSSPSAGRRHRPDEPALPPPVTSRPNPARPAPRSTPRMSDRQPRPDHPHADRRCDRVHRAGDFQPRSVRHLEVRHRGETSQPPHASSSRQNARSGVANRARRSSPTAWSGRTGPA